MNPHQAGRAVRRKSRGAAMTETLLAMFVLFLVLFGMLHVFYFFAGQFFTDYAALRGARSRAVGFADYLVQREIRVNAIGGSGPLIAPPLHSAGEGQSEYDTTQFIMEKTLIQRYMVGATWLEYEYWFGNTASGKKTSTVLRSAVNHSDYAVRAQTEFTNYAFPEANTRWLFFGKGIDLKGSAALGDHAQVYLEN